MAPFRGNGKCPEGQPGGFAPRPPDSGRGSPRFPRLPTMTDPLLTLESTQLSVEPGGQVRVTVTVNNPGKLVEGYRLDVVGDAVSDWAEVVPPEVSVYPAEEASAVVVISPPSGGAAPSGLWPFGVRARSLVDPDGSAVTEGEVEVGKVFGLQAKLVPVTSSGRWRGRHVLHVSNWGNSPVKLTLVPSDPDKALGYLLRPSVLELPVGSEATARLWVRGRRPFLRGSPVRVPFSVVGEQEGRTAATSAVSTAGLATADRPAVDGALNQRPILSRGVVTLAAAALLLGVGGIAWGVTRPLAPGTPGYVDQFPPDQPTNVRAVATGPTTINVTWDPLERVQKWEIRSSQGQNGPVFQVANADPAQTSTTVQGLPAKSEICFQVLGVGFGKNGPLSEPACTSTLEPAASATPSLLPSLPPPGAATASATPTAGTGPVPPPVVPPPPPPGQGGATVGPSPSDTVTGSPSAWPDGGPSTPAGSPASPGTLVPLTGKWVAAGYVTAAASSADPSLQAARAELEADGLAPELIYSADPQYLDLQPVERRFAAPSWVVIVGRYDTREEAEQVCTQRVLPRTGMCWAIQPDPL